MERDEKAREEFKDKISKIDPNDIVPLDETGMNDNAVLEYGWSPKGERIYGLRKSKKSKRISVISTLVNKKLYASFTFQGSCDRSVFETYLEKVLLPNLPKGKFILLDNAAFHKGGNIQKLVEQAGCFLLYLPSYSPDFNPIEKMWFHLKHNAKKFMQFENLDIEEALQKTLIA